MQKKQKIKAAYSTLLRERVPATEFIR